MKETTYSMTLQPRFHGTFSNAKLGGKNARIMAISYVPGNGIATFADGRPVTDVPGTCSGVDCSKCEKACYAMRAYRQYPAVTVNRAENTLQLREYPDKHFDDIREAIIKNNITLVHYTESGEIENLLHFTRLCALAQKCPDVSFYLYTKNYNVLREFFSVWELPENITVLISTWDGQGEKEYQEFRDHPGIKCFAVKPSEDLQKQVQATCPAYKADANGKAKLNKEMTCARCGLCTGKHPAVKVISCIEH